MYPPDDLKDLRTDDLMRATFSPGMKHQQVEHLFNEAGVDIRAMCISLLEA
jgi:hypothetical protein